MVRKTKKGKKGIFLVLILSLLLGIVLWKVMAGPKPQIASQTPVEQHGRLVVKGTKLVDKNGAVFQLKGVSSHGINWDVGEAFVNEQALEDLRDKWNVNCFRVAMFTEDYDNGYCVTDEDSQKQMLETIDRAVEATKKLGMYVIIDWHVLNDATPKKYQKRAKVFFESMAKKYGSYENVLFEICSAPNGRTTWEDIKSYANAVIPVIREYSENIIIVGTPTWSQDVDAAAKSPITQQKNLMYALHFYAAKYEDSFSYQAKVKVAVQAGLPVICTEFSACDSNKAIGVDFYDFASAKKWLELLDSLDIGYVCWSFSNTDEAASLLKASCKKTSGFKRSDLSKMGKWLVDWYGS